MILEVSGTATPRRPAPPKDVLMALSHTRSEGGLPPTADATRLNPAMARIKGANVRPYMAFYTQHYGQERLSQLVDRVPRAHQPLFDRSSPDLGVLDATWYPAEAVHALLDGIRDSVGTGPEADTFAREAARFMMRTTITGVYRWLFHMMMTPERYAAKAQLFFSRYHDTGVMTKTPDGPHTHVTEIREWHGHHPIICDIVLHSSTVTYEAMGCRNVRAQRLSCVSRGGTECRYSVSWDA
jgi:hypothetical protein